MLGYHVVASQQPKLHDLCAAVGISELPLTAALVAHVYCKMRENTIATQNDMSKWRYKATKTELCSPCLR